MLPSERENLNFLIDEYGFNHILSYILFIMEDEFWRQTCKDVLNHIKRFELLYGDVYSEDKYRVKKENGDYEIKSKTLPDYTRKYSELFPQSWKEYIETKEGESND